MDVVDVIWYGGWLLAIMWAARSTTRHTPTLRELSDRARSPR
jgi:hypothetical protein